MISLEAALWDAKALSEGMQFVQTPIAHEVTPHAVTPRPIGRVHEKGHTPSVSAVKWKLAA